VLTLPLPRFNPPKPDSLLKAEHENNVRFAFI
jgi:hypothetical protein